MALTHHKIRCIEHLSVVIGPKTAALTLLCILLYVKCHGSQITGVTSYFGWGSGPILLNNVGCTGSESNLISCTHDPIGEVGDCTHADDVGVMCYIRK